EAIGDDVPELIAVFLASAGEALAAIRAAHGRADADGVYRQAHTLKSSAANVGAMALSALARSLETAAKAGNLGEAEATVEAIEAELARVRPALEGAAAGVAEEAYACA